jgi:membrane fusion protein, multidrug efflux system
MRISGIGSGGRAGARWRSSLACACALAALGGGCRRSAGEARSVAPAVTASHPVEAPVTEYVEMTGTVAASKTVNLVARVPGYLESVLFRDGAIVEAGQTLFVIEQKPYREQVALNEAALVRAQAEVDRQEAMMKEDATARTTVENWVSQRDQAKAQLELAKINLSYTTVTAPFTGRIGARQVDPGNLVGSNGPTTLATLQQLKPIYVNFNLNEQDALRLRDRLREHGIAVGSNVGKAPVEVGLQNETDYPHVGLLDFADTGLSTSTGTIALRAVFPNGDTALFPGLFARVRVPLGGPSPALVVPASAVGSDQQGDFVLVVGPDDVVARKSVVRGPLAAGGVVIRSGISAADRVIVNGLLNARPGEKVAPGEAGGPAPPPPAPTAPPTGAAAPAAKR